MSLENFESLVSSKTLSTVLNAYSMKNYEQITIQLSGVDPGIFHEGGSAHFL